MKMSARLPILLGLTLILAACGSTGTTTGGSVESDLEGRTFLSTEMTQGGAAYDLVPGSVVRLTFGDGRLSANAGCNTLEGDVAFDGSRMTVTSALASTQMACPQELMDQDTWLAALLSCWQRPDGGRRPADPRERRARRWSFRTSGQQCRTPRW